jgi:flagellar biosynthesis protein
MSGILPDDDRDASVALSYDGKSAPRVVAKGYGVIAQKIRDVAQEHNVSVQENALLAQALMQVELDDYIPEELYRAIAEVIGFVLKQRRR